MKERHYRDEEDTGDKKSLYPLYPLHPCNAFLDYIVLVLKNQHNYYDSTLTVDTRVWLVVFEGEIEVTPPGQKDPNPPFHGCSYVIIRKENWQGGGTVGGVDCAQPATWQIK
jgi:hypothetical protein